MKNKKYASIQSTLKGKFLIKEDSIHNWKFITFLMLLAFISITSSHIVDRKIHKINILNDRIRELRSEYANPHKNFMKMQLESIVKKKSHLEVSNL